MFLEKIYYDLKLNKICKDISNNYQFKYDLDNILSNLIYGRIIFPSSKLATNEMSKTFIEQPNLELQHIYRALEVIAKESDFIQSELYKNSLKVIDRNSKILYYDCINYFFEIEEEKILTIDEKIIEKESQYDGFYGVCTNLDDTVEDIIKVNHMRWEIEESFRIMKTEFKSRPVYLSKDDRIQAHFMTCYISLLIHRILEKKLDEKYTTCKIVDSLRNMNMMKIDPEGYIPTYTRTDLTDSLHEAFGFRTDFEITSEKKMKKI